MTIATGASSSSPFYYADTGAGTPTISASATVNTYVVSGSTSGFTMTPGAENKIAITTQPPIIGWRGDELHGGRHRGGPVRQHHHDWHGLDRPHLVEPVPGELRHRVRPRR